MNGKVLTIRFDSDSGFVDALDLSESIRGIEQLTFIGLYLSSEWIEPKRRRNYAIRIGRAREGSLVFDIATSAIEIVHEAHIVGAIDFTRMFLDSMSANAAEREDWKAPIARALRVVGYIERHKQEEFIRLVESMLSRIHKAIVRWIRPIGSSCRSITVSGSDESFTIDIELANVIRGRIKQLQNGTTSEELLIARITGVNRRTNKIEIEVQEEPRPLRATVRDPAFANFPNLYSQAMVDQQDLIIIADVKRRYGKIMDIQIKAIEGVG